jgi:peptidyl-prolyl cis-trans isomerase SurA
MRRLAVMLGLVALLTTRSVSAEPRLVERVVAVVDDQPLLMSELRRRVRPFLVQMRAQNEGKLEPDAIAESYQSNLEAMVEQRLIALEAKRRAITVSADEIETTLAAVAAQNGTSVEVLLDQVQRSVELTPAAYRAELGRQVLEGKLLARLAQPMPEDPQARVAHMQKKRRELLRVLRLRFSVEVRVKFR